MNQVQVFGRLTRDPELRYTPQGKAVANFSIAINRFGENNEADFFDCVAWDKQAENINNSCRKGHRLLVWGRLQQDRWTDQNGQNRSAVRIVVSGFSFIEPPPVQNSQGQPGAQPPAGPPAYGPPGYGYPPQGYPGYVPPVPGGYPPSPNGQQQGEYLGRLGGPPPNGQQPAGQQSLPPTGHPPGSPPGYQYPGQQPPAGGYSGNLDDIPF